MTSGDRELGCRSRSPCGAGAPAGGAPARRRAGRFAVLPGLVLAAAIAATSLGLRELPLVGAISPMAMAAVIGIVLGNSVGTPELARAGLAAAQGWGLRLGVILLGLQLSAQQVAEVGATGAVVITLALAGCFVFTKLLGRALGVDAKLAELLAAGTSVCGASAIVAANTITRAPDEDTAYALACVTIFGCVAMFAYPLLQGGLGLSPQAYGLWAGASIHEVAQVVVAGYQLGEEAGNIATVTKLSRVLMLVPLILVLGAISFRARQEGSRDPAQAKAPIPWFVFGFVALVGVNSVFDVPAGTRTSIMTLTAFLLSAALAGLGTQTDLRRLRSKGLRPFALGLAASLFISVFSLILLVLAG